MAKLDPIIGRYVTLSQGGKDFRIYFEENGTGIPLLCLHTAGAQRLPALAHRHDRAVVADPRPPPRPAVHLLPGGL